MKRDKLAFDNRAARRGLQGKHLEVANTVHDMVMVHREKLRQAKEIRVAQWDHDLKKIAKIQDGHERNQKVKEAHQDFLKDYDNIGWDKEELRLAIAEQLKAHPEATLEGNTVKVGGQSVYRILEGDARFKRLAEQPHGVATGQEVHVKIGTNKHYVRDARGTFVPRYARRAITEDENEQLTSPLTEDQPLLPRDADDTLTDRAEKLFNVPAELHVGDRLSNEQLELLQNRDGTYAQKLLSSTHTKHKIIGNFGHSFEDSPSPPGLGYGGSVFIDLAKIEPGDILNQHLAESRRKKQDAFQGWGKRGTDELRDLMIRKLEGPDRDLHRNWKEAHARFSQTPWRVTSKPSKPKAQSLGRKPESEAEIQDVARWKKEFAEQKKQLMKRYKQDLADYNEYEQARAAEKKTKNDFYERLRILAGGFEPGQPTEAQHEIDEADRSAIRNRETHFKKIPSQSIVTFLNPEEGDVEEHFARFLAGPEAYQEKRAQQLHEASPNPWLNPLRTMPTFEEQILQQQHEIKANRMRLGRKLGIY